MLSELHEDIEAPDLPPVSPEAAEEYKEKGSLLREEVDEDLKTREDLPELLGGNSLKMMSENHKNHVRFMANVFRFNDLQLLVRTVPWVYRSYKNRGFSYDYFPVELKSWMRAVEKHLSSDQTGPIQEIYSYLLDHHRDFIRLAEKGEDPGPVFAHEWKQTGEEFLEGLLVGDHKQCLKIASEAANEETRVRGFFEQVVRPAMYRVGTLWELGEISVAQEHLASSIVTRVLSSLYSQYVDFEYSKGKVVVSAVANEFHEIGSRVVSDALELDGWDVDHLGVDTPVTDLVDMLVEKEPFLLGLSVALPSNIDEAAETVQRVRSVPELAGLKVLIGGKVFNDYPGLWEHTGADACSQDSNEAVSLANEWWENA